MRHYILVLAALLAPVLSFAQTNLLTNPGFESGLTTWSFWARTVDSSSYALVATPCHAGSQCISITDIGALDWSLSAPATPVQPGEVWQWSLWTRIDSLPGSASVSLVTRTAGDTVLDWGAASLDLGRDTGWMQQTTQIVVPTGCASLTPRLIGAGHEHLYADDGNFSRVSAAPTVNSYVLQSDSLRVSISAIDFSMVLKDSIGGDSVLFGGVTNLHVQSATKNGDTLIVQTQVLPSDWPLEVHCWLHGGELRILLHADSARVLAAELLFPGVPNTYAGQRLAMPRGTGLAWPVDQLTSPYAFNSAEFWEWQVTQALTGVTDGKTGFMASFDQPWDTRMYYSPHASTLAPSFYHEPAKGVWGHDRSFLLAPLRGGGWTEMAKRHRARLAELGRVRSFADKLTSLPQLALMQGAVDFWMSGSWYSVQPTFFDTLRLYGMDKAIINWNWATGPQVDSLNAHGWLTSSYTDYSDAFPASSGMQSLEYPTGALVKQDGSIAKGWLSYLPNGDSAQAVEVCPLRHPSMAKTILSNMLSTVKRKATFIDVELAMTPQECFSPDHPTDLAGDARARLATFSMARDTFGLVVGSEQTRDYAHALVDWGEGSMSIATTANAGYDWDTPVPPEAHMDSLSMDPSIRVPLLLLTDHDAFAPTWYTGDGQSKVPLRWDDKDAWNILYATMPLIMPQGDTMWAAHQVRYLRSAALGGGVHSRCGFAEMTSWKELTTDRMVQQTTFGNGWTVTANFDATIRDAGGFSLPGKGYLATNGNELVERMNLDGAVRSRLHFQDRWFLDPEGSQASIDGVRTSDAVFLRKENDTTLLLSLPGSQSSVDFSPSQLPWPATRLAVSSLNGTRAYTLSDLGSGWLHLAVGQDRIMHITGDFGNYQPAQILKLDANIPRLIRNGNQVEWTQSSAGPALLQVFRIDGTVLQELRTNGHAGVNTLTIQAFPGIGLLRLQSPAGTQVLRIVHLGS